MYEVFYGLSAVPFRLSPDRRFYFESKSHSKALSYLRYGLHQGEGFIVITGDIGAGKTTLVNELFSELDSSRVVAAQIATTSIEADDMLRLIAQAFHVTGGADDKASLLGRLESFMREQNRAGRRILLVVDEAQNLPLRTLEELRMLSNFQVGGQSLFQSFLLGQPQFNIMLADPSLEQLRQRVIASCNLEPISSEETRQYIEHRLRTAGWSGDPQITDAAFDAVHHITGGIPRRINTLCNRLFLYGALEELHKFDARAVEEVMHDLQAEGVEQPLKGRIVRGAESLGLRHNSGGPSKDMPARLEKVERSVAVHDNAINQLMATTTELLSLCSRLALSRHQQTSKSTDAGEQ